MAQMSFSTDWLKKFSDPYAVLGISVSADERRITKRYRDIAKLLHPDRYVDQTQTSQAQREMAGQLLARLVNPAYQQLKQDKGRAESLATLRFRVRRLTREQSLAPKHPTAIQLLRLPAAEADIFYEQAITEVAAQQYQDLEKFERNAYLLSELNLVYLRVKMGEPIIRQKRAGLMATPQNPSTSFTASPPEQTSTASTEEPTVDYAQRHYQRATEYAKKGIWPMAVQELRDAIRIEPKRSEYHALLGMVYHRQNLAGMAAVHIRQALKLNPQDPLARKYAEQLKISVEAPDTAQKAKQRGSFFGNLFARKD